MAMARYGDASDVAWEVGRIMLKYRPIAPKPVTGGAVTAWPVDAMTGGGRGKRRGAGRREGGGRGRKGSRKSAAAAASVGVEAGAFREGKGKYNNNNNNNNNNNIDNNDNTFSSSSSSRPVVTLPLMPMTPERKEEETPAPTPSPTASDGRVVVSVFGRTAAWRQQQAPKNNSDNNSSSGSSASAGSGSSSVVVAPHPVRLLGSWVTVEGVTDTWREGEVALASPALLEKDTCPGFISDANDKVTWTNAAYRRMVGGPGGGVKVDEVGAGEGDHGGDEGGMRVALVTRGMVPAPAPADAGVTCFTCLVSVQYACRGRGKASMVAPCDVWRLAGGRLAWRLDVKAALSLSLGS